MLKLKLQYFGYLMRRANSLEKTLMLGKIEGRRRRGLQRRRWLDGIIDSMEMSLSKLWEMVKDREPRYAAVHVVAKSCTQLSNSSSSATEQQWSDSSGINSKVLIGPDSQKLSWLVTKQPETKDTREDQAGTRKKDLKSYNQWLKSSGQTLSSFRSWLGNYIGIKSFELSFQITWDIVFLSWTRQNKR